MKQIENQTFPNERDLYGINGARIVNCAFEGAQDGESALKEAKNVILEGCRLALRYPLWHDENVKLKDVLMTEGCRAALWYTDGIEAENSRLLGIKALRECSRAAFQGCTVDSPEFGWKSRDIAMEDCSVESEYLFLLSKDIVWKNVRFRGKYSFQYTENVTIEHCELDTKDAFWHAKNVTVKNSTVKGEYLGWYSENLTFINCKIVGTQPLCYCKNLKLIGCETEGTDFAFEYSDVEADIKGQVLSIKNPRSGQIVADGYGEVLLTEDSKYPCKCLIETRQ